ncbi:MAG: iron hydrogenase small subunit [Parachlamydiales bacterium]|nr:iron hydrogenase small subunit [Parachlamydiales bacterium]
MNILINGQQLHAEEGDTILNVCRKNSIDIPTLCFHPDLFTSGRCRICIVKVHGKIVTSCNTCVQENMEVITEDPEIFQHRKILLELMIGNAPHILAEDNEVTRLAKRYGIHKAQFAPKQKKHKDDTSGCLVFDNNKCILCGRCVQKCQITQGVYAIGYGNRGEKSVITTYPHADIKDSVCINCGQCSVVCPTGAIKEKDYSESVYAALKDPNKHVIIQPAPSIRASIAETQGLPPGTISTGQLVTVLKMMGFDKVVDTNFGADLTIIEEGTELIERIQNKGPLPLITSCSPGWVKFIEHFYPDMLPLVSSCKSPQQMTGTLIKTYYAQKNNYDPKDIVSVSIMPCVAKKFEAKRPEMHTSGYQDVDYVLTTREMGRMIQKMNIDFQSLPETPFDSFMGESSGAAVIFAVTGGVMEAALRFASEVLEKKTLEAIDYKQVRGLQGIKEATLSLGGMDITVAVAHGTGNAHKLMHLIQEHPHKYHFIEIMACEGGCIGGGGQPIPTTKKIIAKRSEAVYAIDKHLPYRKSQQNPEIIQLYKDFLGKPGGELAHKYLHTHYKKRSLY